jgi:uncharacterized membrane protein YdjX (TVP38/TMEM64 family)
VNGRAITKVRTVLPRLLLLLFLAGALAIFYTVIVKGGMRPQDLPQIFDKWGWPGKLAYVTVYAVSAGLVMPIPFFLAGAGFLFGIGAGFPVAVVGATACACVAYLYGRYLLRDLFTKYFGDLAERVEKLVSEKGFLFLFLWRLLFLPWLPMHIACGLAGLPLGRYVVATALGTMPAAFIWVYAGGRFTKAFESIKRGEFTDPVVLMLAGLLLVTIVGATIFKKRFSIDNAVIRENSK